MKRSMGLIGKLGKSMRFTRLLLRFVNNWFDILYLTVTNKRVNTLEVELKDNHKIFLRSVYDLYVLLNLLERGWKVKEAYENNIILCKEICLNIRTTKGADIIHLDEIYERKIYGKSFRGVIIDVGASNADSSIFFAINGAEKVIALEPFPESYELGKYNIKINNLENKVFLLPYALANYESYTEFIISSDNPNANTVNPSPYIIGSGMKFEQKIKVPTISLTSIIKKYNIDTIFLFKMDCEGCEYTVLRDLPADILNRIENIILEFHDYPKDLPDILRKSGFNVDYEDKPIGILKAYKNDKLIIQFS